MNAHASTIAAASPATFPIPFPNQDPRDDLVAALSTLRVVTELLGDGHSLSANMVQNVLTVIHFAIERMEPVADFLDNMPGDHRKGYIGARRQWILRNYGRAEAAS